MGWATGRFTYNIRSTCFTEKSETFSYGHSRLKVTGPWTAQIKSLVCKIPTAYAGIWQFGLPSFDFSFFFPAKNQKKETQLLAFLPKRSLDF
jgi:hypothetical protein